MGYLLGEVTGLEVQNKVALLVSEVDVAITPKHLTGLATDEVSLLNVFVFFKTAGLHVQ